MRQLSIFLDENDETPFKALTYTVGECNYGGRVTDDKDRRTLHCILDTCYRSANMTEGSSLSESGAYFIPPDGTYGEYKAFADSLPLVTEPEVCRKALAGAGIPLRCPLPCSLTHDYF